MRNWTFILLLFFFGCSNLIDRPKNLISKNEMSELVAEFAINDQINIYIPGTNVEDATKLALQQRNLKAKDFVESYKFYTASGELEKILNNAQEIILEKDPAAKDYIEKKLKENKTEPNFAR